MTEKAQKDIEEWRYSFIVHSDANKNDVKVAMEKLYNLTPKSVHIMTYKPKFRFNRKVRQWFKKAIVTLKKGDTIELL